MRVAFAGKGGVGKTTIAAGMARTAAREGRSVVAIDADSNPNLATALGVPDGAAGPTTLPGELVSRRLRGPLLTAPIDEVLARYAVASPDGVRLLVMGMPSHAGEGCLCAGHATVGAVLGDLSSRPDLLAVADLEASPEHLSRGTAQHVDVLLLVTEPYYRALESVRRLARLAADLPIPRVAVLANKIRSREHGAAIEEFCARHDLELVGAVPWSDKVQVADLRRRPLFERDDEALAAISRLGAGLREQPSVGGASAGPVGGGA